MHIVDADDFHETNNGFKYLDKIKEKVPEFKINLFTIIGKCSGKFVEDVKKLDWIDMIPHGWVHITPLECQKWAYKRSKQYLRDIERFGLTKGFKAPGWQISDGMYQALLEENYWVADQPYNNHRRPKKLKTYMLDSPNKLHFHIQNVCGNGLEESLDKLINLKGQFGFIKDI